MKKPVEEATNYCELGVDKAGFDVRYINDFIGKLYLSFINCCIDYSSLVTKNKNINEI